MSKYDGYNGDGRDYQLRKNTEEKLALFDIFLIFCGIFFIFVTVILPIILK